ncbi:BgtAcSP-30775 [Blumeria graminis f. sp. tritici]|uniref:BgtAcSP-30775 n=2 Tax=Blumeria graminis f. sp. tritici TaxID=62690 RepID=A0A9X9MPI8_BLUGR|nr:hypothetical protein BGT96224_AcSP30775 [Blumeria graminis f. sp. tritici 96224]VDB94998.1 BgtAcSP-30775 [Blumeria graminis f. sp. tritici]
MQYSLFLSFFGLSFVWAVSSTRPKTSNNPAEDNKSTNINEKEYMGHIPYYHGKPGYQGFPDSGMTCGEWTITKAGVDKAAENACKEFNSRKHHMWIRTRKVRGLYYNPKGKSRIFKKRHYMYPLQNQQSIKKSEEKPIPVIFIDNSCKLYAVYIRSRVKTRRFALFSKTKFGSCWDARTGIVKKTDRTDSTAGITKDEEKTTVMGHTPKQPEIKIDTPAS